MLLLLGVEELKFSFLLCDVSCLAVAHFQYFIGCTVAWPVVHHLTFLRLVFVQNVQLPLVHTEFPFC